MGQLSSFSVMGYSPLRPLSLASNVYLCREDASDRIIVIKFKEEPEMGLIKNEIFALRDLKDYPYSPRLLFSFLIKQNDGADKLVLGEEYITGEPLQFMVEKLSNEEKKNIKFKLETALNLLHHHFGRSHGDISPKNILVHRKTNDQIELCLVDWEYSEKIIEENTSHHSNFRGTIGYMDPNSKKGLKEKDNEAMKNVILLLNIDIEKGKRGFLPW